MGVDEVESRRSEINTFNLYVSYGWDFGLFGRTSSGHTQSSASADLMFFRNFK